MQAIGLVLSHPLTGWNVESTTKSVFLGMEAGFKATAGFVLGSLFAARKGNLCTRSVELKHGKTHNALRSDTSA